MPNMSNLKVKMKEQDPQVRNRNFDEVTVGYTKEEAFEEAARCLQCKNPKCVEGCPVNVKIPEFIKLISEDKIDEANKKIMETNSLPAVCGRVCPQESQCEKYCIRAIKGESVAIGRLERFAADNARTIENLQLTIDNDKEKKEVKKDNSQFSILNSQLLQRKVAIVGSGPAGLSCAGDLAQMGYNVTIFEAFHVPGGVLMYGIPEFRLPKKIVQKEIDNLRKLGVKIETNMVIGKIYTVDELFKEGYSAVFVGSGAGLPGFMGIPGENLNGVMSANEFLTRINLMKAYRFPESDTPVKFAKKVAVVGGGNVAMDAARSAMRLGAENVYIVYRRSEDEMPARCEEVHHAKEEGIELKLLTNPLGILGTDDGWVKGMECVEMELGEPDASGRRTPIEKKGSEHIIDVDMVIMSVGTSPNSLIADTTERLETTKKGCITADEVTGQTSREGVFAGGDAVTGAATVIQAMGAGKKAAKAIDEYVRQKKDA